MKCVNIENTSLAYHEMGSGPVILMVHGFPLDHTMWHPLMELLSTSHRCIAVDLPGFGESELFRKVNHMSEFAQDCDALLDALGIDEPVTFCGLSMGGYVGWEFWHQFRDRVDHLIMCDTKADSDSELAQQNRKELAQKVVEEGTEIVATTLPNKLFSSKTYDSNLKLVEKTRNLISSTNPNAIAAASLGMAERQNAVRWLDEIKCPTLLICGEDDAISPPEEMKNIHDHLPVSQLRVIKNAGHMAPLEQPEDVAEAIREFLMAEVNDETD